MLCCCDSKHEHQDADLEQETGGDTAPQEATQKPRSLFKLFHVPFAVPGGEVLVEQDDVATARPTTISEWLQAYRSCIASLCSIVRM